ncbi:MAG: N-acetylmuramoyl-L-alanine amidase, partial [Myxococcaceae bacterium]
MRSLFGAVLILANVAAGVAAAQTQTPEEYWKAQDCGLLPPGSYTPSPVPVRPWEHLLSPNQPPLVRQEINAITPRAGGIPLPRVRAGSLTGKVIYISAGHGFTWTDTLNRWATQRDTTNAIVEDLVSTETMSQWLIPMLQNAGATVVPIRESDINTNMVIADNETAADYTEAGPTTLFSASSLAGFKPLPATIDDTFEPFTKGGNRLMDAVTGTATASATYAPVVPKDGYYNVYVSYSSFTARASDAHYVVKHAGGQTSFRINQQRHGATWVLLGRFYFKAGRDPQNAAVVVMNDSTDSRIGTSTVNISLDAVRFGGGNGLIARANTGGTPVVSGRPRFEESARYGTQFNGAPYASVIDPNNDHVDRTDDVRCRSRFAAWHHETGEDAIYVAWHTNAFDGTARGTQVYCYGPNGPPSPMSQFSGVPGSDTLAIAVESEIANDIHASWDPNWQDRGPATAYFGEIDPAENNEMPSILMEVAFHDNAADATQLKEPQFRYLVTRAIAQGIIKWFATKDGRTAVMPPEVPQSVAAKNMGGGQVSVAWQAPAAGGGGNPASYYLYTSKDGLSWDDGTPTTNTTLSVSVPTGEVRYFRVTAVNTGGESFPSQIVGAKSGTGTSHALIVNGFDRFDAVLGRNENLSAYQLGNVLRIIAERMNDGTYVRQHGDAIALAGYGFDSATNDAISGGLASLTGYKVVDWLQGRGVTATNGGPSASEVSAMSAYFQAGGHLLISGTEIAREFSTGTTTQQQFLSSVLGVSTTTGTGSATVAANPASFLAGMSNMTLDNGLSGTYPTGAPDSVSASGSTVIATYGTGTATAAVAFVSGSGKSVYLAFPYETVTSANVRNNLMARILA